MQEPSNFDIQCPECGTSERLTYRAMRTRQIIRCIFCGAAREMSAKALTEICRDAAITTQQRL